MGSYDKWFYILTQHACIGNRNELCFIQQKWTVFYSATNHWAEECEAKSRRFVMFLRIFLMLFALSWTLDCVMSFFFASDNYR